MAEATQLYAEVVGWPPQERMAELLRAAGLRIWVGRYSIRLEDCEHFVFQEYGGDLGEPYVEADASSPERLRVDAWRVSQVLAAAGLVHRFELYDQAGSLVGYFHHGWPPEQPV